jgi:hypothetical protein
VGFQEAESGERRGCAEREQRERSAEREWGEGEWRGRVERESGKGVQRERAESVCREGVQRGSAEREWGEGEQREWRGCAEREQRERSRE